MDSTTVVYNFTKEVKEFDESKIGVKGLSDSGITTIPKFFVHPPETRPEPKLATKHINGIPLIDLSQANRAQLVQQIKEAASSWGFFQVINHGVPVSVLDDTTRAVKAFHEKPHEIKAKFYKRQELKGVMYANNNDLYRTKAASWHDYLQVWMGPEPPPINEIPDTCRDEMLAWDVHAKQVAENLMEYLSEGLGLDSNKFKELTFSEERVMVGTIYPHCPQPDLTVGLKWHTDPGVITVLLTNHVPGLQVKHEDEWVDVKPIHGSLIINVGDLLQIVTNGEYKSIEHRVLANSWKEARISVVVFLNLSKWVGDGYHGPLPELLNPEKPAIYRNFTKKEFLDNFFDKELDSKSLIEKLKIRN